MAKENVKIGDVFSTQIDNNYKKYFQYIANDITQLNSEVIRVFKTQYSIDVNSDLIDIVDDEIDFYAHCVIQFGLKLKLWERIGNVSFTEKINVLFKTSTDNGKPEVKISHDWYVWKINEGFNHVGKLKGENRYSEVGSIIPPDSIVYRMLHGEYDFVYPKFE